MPCDKDALFQRLVVTNSPERSEVPFTPCGANRSRLGSWAAFYPRELPHTEGDDRAQGDDFAARDGGLLADFTDLPLKIAPSHFLLPTS